MLPVAEMADLAQALVDCQRRSRSKIFRATLLYVGLMIALMAITSVTTAIIVASPRNSILERTQASQVQAGSLLTSALARRISSQEEAKGQTIIGEFDPVREPSRIKDEFALHSFAVGDHIRHFDRSQLHLGSILGPWQRPVICLVAGCRDLNEKAECGSPPAQPLLKLMKKEIRRPAGSIRRTEVFLAIYRANAVTAIAAGPLRVDESKGVHSVVRLCGEASRCRLQAMKNLHFYDWLPQERIFRENAGLPGSATAAAVRYAYDLLGDDVCDTCPRRKPAEPESEAFYYVI
jgi:hypothetical protein